MQNKNIIVFLILGSFVLGAVFFSLFSSFSKSKPVTNTNEKSTATINNGNAEEGEVKQPENSKIPEIATRNAIDLSGQGLEKLPTYVLARTNLEELNISNNNLTGALPSEIGKLKKLKILNASNNSMTGVPAEIGHLPDLEVLDLSNNELTGLPNELANLKKLKVLNLSGNAYSEQDLDIIRKGLSSEVKIIL